MSGRKVFDLLSKDDIGELSYFDIIAYIEEANTRIKTAEDALAYDLKYSDATWEKRDKDIEKGENKISRFKEMLKQLEAAKANHTDREDSREQEAKRIMQKYIIEFDGSEDLSLLSLEDLNEKIFDAEGLLHELENKAWPLRQKHPAGRAYPALEERIDKVSSTLWLLKHQREKFPEWQARLAVLAEQEELIKQVKIRKSAIMKRITITLLVISILSSLLSFLFVYTAFAHQNIGFIMVLFLLAVNFVVPVITIYLAVKRQYWDAKAVCIGAAVPIVFLVSLMPLNNHVHGWYLAGGYWSPSEWARNRVWIDVGTPAWVSFIGSGILWWLLPVVSVAIYITICIRNKNM